MKGFEKQLERIADKAALHAWIDEQPEGTTGLILIRLPEEVHTDGCGKTHESYRYREIGDITVAQSVYMVKSWEHFIFDDFQ